MHQKISMVLALSALGGMMLAQLMAVVLGQVTVRRLRKDPRIRQRLGAEFVSGWDIFNVASALSRPRWLTRRVERGGLAGLFADSQALLAHTTSLDRALARICYWGGWLSVGCLVTWMVFERFG